MKQQINFRASDLTGRQLAQLTQQTGMLQTEVIAVAIDRMFQEETMDKLNYVIRFGSGVVINEEHTTIIGAKRSATGRLAFGSGNVTLECPDGAIWCRKFNQSLNKFWWDEWEQVN